MPKTGTSSIQESLYFGLADPAFRYVGLGEPNGSLWIESIFAERPEDFWVFRMQGRSGARLRLARRFTPAARRPGFRARMLLIKAFEDLDGPRLRLREDLFAPAAEAVDREQETILDRYGIDLSVNRAESDGGPRIREEADMFRYSRASLDWLAETSRSNPIAACEGEAAAREVAAQVDQIRRRPSWRNVGQMLAGRIRKDLRSIRHGD